jgi:phosphoribosyl-ATP pyrophosphohydrolase/phosphoribosyl-AMP cyclohydrolase
VTTMDATLLDALRFDARGLVPVIAQHALTGEVLMLAWADRAALERTLDERVMWYWSRSRNALWKKGETSGNVQRLVSLHHDCDSDALLARVLPDGPTCHTGAWSCFAAPPTLAALDATIEERTRSGAGYTGRLLGDGNLRLKKLGEEAVELALACGRGDVEGVAEEGADLLYHVMVACRAAGVPTAAVLAVLEQRAGRALSASDDAR